MKLSDRFKRLTLWNKLGAAGSLASLAGVILAVAAIVLAVVFWLYPASETPAPIVVVDQDPIAEMNRLARDLSEARVEIRPAGDEYRVVDRSMAVQVVNRGQSDLANVLVSEFWVAFKGAGKDLKVRRLGAGGLLTHHAGELRSGQTLDVEVRTHGVPSDLGALQHATGEPWGAALQIAVYCERKADGVASTFRETLLPANKFSMMLSKRDGPVPSFLNENLDEIGAAIESMSARDWSYAKRAKHSDPPTSE